MERSHTKNRKGMRMRKRLLLFVLPFVLAVTLNLKSTALQTPDHALPQKKHLRNLKQLTFGGENAEAYLSSDGKKLTFQSSRVGHDSDQIYTIKIEVADVNLS